MTKFALRKINDDETYVLDRARPFEYLYLSIFNIPDFVNTFPVAYYDLKSAIVDELSKLTSDEVFVLQHHFGLDENQPMPLSRISTDYDMTYRKVILNKKDALEQLKYPSKTEKYGIRYYSKPSQHLGTIENINIKTIIKNDIKSILLKNDKIDFFDKICERYDFVIFSDDDFDIDMDMEDLGLSIRSYNCLKRADINTVSELLALSDDELLNVRNLGLKGYEEIIRKIEALGMKRFVYRSNNKYKTVKIKKQKHIEIFKYYKASLTDIADSIYDEFIKTFNDYTLITKYNLSLGLTFFLLSNGFYFINSVIDNESMLLEQLKYLKFQKYYDELENLLKSLKRDNLLNTSLKIITSQDILDEAIKVYRSVDKIKDQILTIQKDNYYKYTILPLDYRQSAEFKVVDKKDIEQYTSDNSGIVNFSEIYDKINSTNEENKFEIIE